MGVNDIVNIGNIIKTIRILFNYSQKEMAEKLGIAPSTYSGYETNYREPSKEIINKISEIFGINSTDLIILGALISRTIKRDIPFNKLEEQEHNKQIKEESLIIETLLNNIGLEFDINFTKTLSNELSKNSKEEKIEDILKRVLKENYNHSNK